MSRAGIVVVMLLIGACAGPRAPTPPPAGFEDIVASLVRRGATITDQVSGDAGCADSTLYGNALRLDIRMPDETEIRPIYLLGWRRTSDYEAAGPAFDACVDSFETSHPTAQVTSMEKAPWRAFGPDWNAGLQSVVDQALTEASGS